MPTERRSTSRRGHPRNLALADLYKGSPLPGRSTLFLDFDDVICLNRPYGFEHLGAKDLPADFYARLWHLPAVYTLLTAIELHKPSVVVTSSWLRFLTMEVTKSLFYASGLGLVATAMHPAWDAPQMRGQTRHDAIEAWLTANYAGGEVVVIDDVLSGTGLSSSVLDRQRRVVLCKPDIGLHDGHLPQIAAALRA